MLSLLHRVGNELIVVRAVTPSNNPPVWNSQPVINAILGAAQSWDMDDISSDPDLDPITHSLNTGAQALPAGFAWTPATGVLDYDGIGALIADSGHVFTLNDGTDTTDSSSITFNVTAGLTAQTLRDAGYLLVDDYVGVDTTGANDSTAGFNLATLDSESTGKTIWLTENATYRLTSTWLCGTWGSGPGVRVQGGGVGASRPQVILDDGAAGFGSAGDPQPVVCFRNFENGIADRTWPSDPMNNSGINQGKSANAFDNFFSNVDIDCGVNAGAFGMYMPSAQYSFASDVTIDCSNALGGWRGCLGRNSPMMNIKVIGGVWEIKNEGRTGEGTAGSMIVGLTLVGDARTITPIESDDFVPMTIVGFDFTRTTSGSFVNVQAHTKTSNSQFCLIDGIIRSVGGTVFDNAVGKNIYVRNVYVTGTNDLIQSKAEALITGAGTWKIINEYVYNDITPFNTNDPKYPSESLIDGVISAAEEPATSISASVVAPTVDYIARHTIVIPKIDSGPFVNILDHGAVSGPSLGANGAYSSNNDNTTADSRAAIQAAITAATAAGHNTVFVPRGFFYVGSPGLNLDPNTIFIGTGQGSSVIGTHGSWQPTSQVYVITSANDAAGTAHYSGVSIAVRTIDGTGGGSVTPYQFDWFSFLHWRTGRNSSVISVNINSREFQPAGNVMNMRTFHEYSGNAGGKHYGWDVVNRPFANPAARTVRIKNTTEPLHIYGCNTEASKNAPSGESIVANIEIDNCSNIRLYSNKREGQSMTLLLNNSTNIAFYGLGRQSLASVTGNINVHKIIGASDKILIGLSSSDSAGESIGSSPHVFEDLDAQAAVQIDWVKGISVYKRGVLDDAAVTI